MNKIIKDSNSVFPFLTNFWVMLKKDFDEKSQKCMLYNLLLIKKQTIIKTLGFDNSFPVEYYSGIGKEVLDYEKNINENEVLLVDLNERFEELIRLTLLLNKTSFPYKDTFFKDEDFDLIWQKLRNDNYVIVIPNYQLSNKESKKCYYKIKFDYKPSETIWYCVFDQGIYNLNMFLGCQFKSQFPNYFAKNTNSSINEMMQKKLYWLTKSENY